MKNMTISDLAKMIEKDWGEVSSHARPYLSAMNHLNDIKDAYCDNYGEKIVVYFLCNAVSWRGNLAMMIKKELNRRIQG